MTGANDNFMDLNFATQASLQSVRLDRPLVSNALDGRHHTKVTQRTDPVLLVVLRNHRERVSFNLISSPYSPVMGLPWLGMHNPFGLGSW